MRVNYLQMFSEVDYYGGHKTGVKKDHSERRPVRRRKAIIAPTMPW